MPNSDGNAIFVSQVLRYKHFRPNSAAPRHALNTLSHAVSIHLARTYHCLRWLFSDRGIQCSLD